MNIIEIKPRGFCCGVASAVFYSFKVAKKYKGRKIYMLGNIIHNKYLNKKFIENNITILDDSKKNRYDILNDKIENGSVVIFSAHGTASNVFELAKKKNCTIVDTTCVYVSKTHNIIKKYLANDYKILFIGVNNHPETNAILSISDNILLIENIYQAKNLNSFYKINDKIFVTNQTTISQYEFQDILEYLDSKFNNIVFENDICNATKIRQEAIYNLNCSNIDMLIVVGDIESNNSKKLVQVGESKNIKSVLISNPEQINKELFRGIENVAITAGASTPDELIINIQEKIKLITN